MQQLSQHREPANQSINQSNSCIYLSFFYKIFINLDGPRMPYVTRGPRLCLFQSYSVMLNILTGCSDSNQFSSLVVLDNSFDAKEIEKLILLLLDLSHHLSELAQSLISVLELNGHSLLKSFLQEGI